MHTSNTKRTALAEELLRQEEDSSEPQPAVAPFSAASVLTDTLFSIAVVVFLLGTFGGHVRFWYVDGKTVLPAARYAWIAAVLFALPALWQCWRQRRLPLMQPFVFASGLLVVFFSDWLLGDYQLLKGPSIRGEILFAAACTYLLLKRNWRLWAAALFPIASLLLFFSFYYGTEGKLIIGDDHGVFVHRLSLLKNGFPEIPVFDALWNGGLDSLHLLATGVMNVFLIGMPLVYLLPIEQSYSFLVASILFFLLPVCSYFAGRLIGLRPAVASLAAVLAASQSLLLFRWGLAYGAMGFVVSLALLPLVFVLVLRLLSSDKDFSSLEALHFTVSLALMLCWPLSGIVLVPAVLYAGVRVRSLLRFRRAIIAALAVLLLTLPWVYVLWSGWKVADFIAAGSGSKEVSQQAQLDSRAQTDVSKVPMVDQAQAPTQDEAPAQAAQKLDSENAFKGHVFRSHRGRFSLAKGLEIARTKVTAAQPLLLILVVPGIALLARGRLLFGLTISWLLGLAVVGGPLKPQLELGRMLLFAGALASIPTAAGLAYLFDACGTSKSKQLLASLAGGFLLAGLLSAGVAAQNKSVERYYTWNQAWDQVVAALQQLPEGGRIAFSGFVLHEMEQGHLAPLSHKVPRPMVASSHVHNVWSYTELVPPEFFKQGESGIESYFDLLFVTAVTAHEPFWQQYFSERPERYSFVRTAGPFQIFLRKTEVSSYFLQGKGRVIRQDTNGVELQLTSDAAVLRFAYQPALLAEGCEVHPYPVSKSLVFVELQHCPNTASIHLRAKTLLERLGASLK